MSEPRVEIVKGLRLAFLKAMGFDGFTTFWNTIWVKPDLPPKRFEQVIKHEQAHIAQIQKEDIFRFTIGYLSEHFKNGYRNNKYELEARIKAGEF